MQELIEPKSQKKIEVMVMLRLFIEKLQQGFSVFTNRRPDVDDVVPDDVKEGHFAVLAIKGKEVKRFVIDLSYLNHPAFLRLLDQAGEEYGFQQKGALAVPCRPEELQKILGDMRREDGNCVDQGWATSSSVTTS